MPTSDQHSRPRRAARAFRAVSIAVWGIASCGFAGCGSSGPSVGGTVTFEGRPLTTGFVMFQTAGGIQQATIGTDGSYRVGGLVPGEARVAVVGPARPAVGPDGVSADVMPAGELVFIPEKYARVETSGLSCTVGNGTQQHDIPLE